MVCSICGVDDGHNRRTCPHAPPPQSRQGNVRKVAEERSNSCKQPRNDSSSSSDAPPNTAAKEEDIVEVLSKCVVCLMTPMKPPIRQSCKNNMHVLCDACYKKMATDTTLRATSARCPQCRAPFLSSPIRNNLLERQIEQKLGNILCACGISYKYRDGPDHERACPETTFSCPLWCCSDIVSVARLAEHIAVAHEDEKMTGTSCSMSLRGFMENVRTWSAPKPGDMTHAGLSPIRADINRNAYYNAHAHGEFYRIPRELVDQKAWRLHEVHGMYLGYNFLLGTESDFPTVRFKFFTSGLPRRGLFYVAKALSGHQDVRFHMQLFVNRFESGSNNCNIKRSISFSHYGIAPSLMDAGVVEADRLDFGSSADEFLECDDFSGECYVRIELYA